LETCPEYPKPCMNTLIIDQKLDAISDLVTKNNKEIKAKLDALYENRVANGQFKGKTEQQIKELERQSSKLFELWDNKISAGLVKIGILSGKGHLVIAIIGAVCLMVGTSFLSAYFTSCFRVQI